YMLHNPPPAVPARAARLRLERADFASNLDDAFVEHMILHFVSSDGPVPATKVSLKRGSLGGEAQSFNAVISTRRGNAPAWAALAGQPAYGDWELVFEPTAGQLFEQER